MSRRISRMTRRCTCDRRSLGKDDLHKGSGNFCRCISFEKENPERYVPGFIIPEDPGASDVFQSKQGNNR